MWDLDHGNCHRFAGTEQIEVNFTLSDESNHKIITFPGKLFFPGLLFPFIPRKYWRLRVVTKYTKFQWSAGVQGGDFSFALPDPKLELAVSEWLKIGLLLDIVLDHEKSGFKLEVSFSSGSQKFHQPGTFSVSNPESFQHFRSAVSALSEIAKKTNLNMEWSISMADLLGQKHRLDLLRAAIDGSSVDIVATVIQKDLPESYNGGLTALFKVMPLQFGNNFLCAFISFTANATKQWRPEHDAWELQIKPERPHLYSSVFLERPMLKIYPFQQKLQEYADQLGDSVKLSLIPTKPNLVL